jgi:CRISPR system Cascade subunit CasD
MDFLLFRLYGPMAAWGTIAVGQERPSDAHPSKSALLGLLAAAMGVRRHQDEVHQRMAAAYGFAVRVDAPGTLLRDYHTVQVPPTRRHVVHYTRRDELHAEALNTILSSREYRCDALYTVALWVRDVSTAPFSLEELVAGLHRPHFPLYLGRKSCPLALPVQAMHVTAADLEAAFAQARFKDDVDLMEQSEAQRTDLFERPKQVLLYWEADDSNLDTGTWRPLQTMTRRDQLLHRRRWQFVPRREHQAQVRRQLQE